MEQSTLQLGEFAVVLFLWTFSRKGAETLRAGSFVWQRRHGAPDLVIQDNREGHRVLLIQRGIFHCHFRWKIDTPTWCPHSRHHAEVKKKGGRLKFNFLAFFSSNRRCVHRQEVAKPLLSWFLWLWGSRRKNVESSSRSWRRGDVVTVARGRDPGSWTEQVRGGSHQTQCAWHHRISWDVWGFEIIEDQ